MNSFSFLEKLLFYCGVTGVLAIPLSLSISQSLLYISSFSLILLLVLYKKIQIYNKPQFLKSVFPIVLLFIIFLISLIYHKDFKNIYKTEIKDLFLIFPFFWSYYYFSNTIYKEKLQKVLFTLFIIYLIIGIVALFIPFRLSNLLYHFRYGFFFTGEKRFQHLSFSLDFLPFHWNLEGISYPPGIYMPVGFSGTHLSFGGQIAIISIFFLYIFLFSFYDFFITRNSSKKNSFIIRLFLLLISLTILFFGQARSAILGFSVAAFFLILSYFLVLDKKINKFKLIFKGMIFLILIFAVLLIIIFQNENLQHIFFYLIGLEKKHTDYQRMVVWYLSFELFLKNFLLGVGPGNFEHQAFLEILQVLKTKPQLWYEMYQTEIMHAHNDFLHLLAISGILGGIFLLLFFYLQLKNLFIFYQKYSLQIFERNADLTLIFLILPLFLLFAGIFQCYFLEDRTMMLFWFLYGSALSKI